MSSSSLLCCLLVVCVLAVVQIYAAEERKVLKVFNLRASDLNSGLFQTPDAYVKVFMGSGYGGKTEVKNDNTDPWWKEDFNFFNARENDPLRLEVYDSDVVFDDLLGTCERSIKNGTWQHSCSIKRGGILSYSYTLEPLQ
ncbi:GTPase activating protein 1-like [Coregonus clupeaformis]|uniref:GTPase activating protein 1-like n=1 Tax=Coregonus clupeaformis TaxID=59861 RepID=UPI001BE126EE|nr:GTPase activating protein 1-like [Coregonus clupeaformis]